MGPFDDGIRLIADGFGFFGKGRAAIQNRRQAPNAAGMSSKLDVIALFDAA